MRAKTLLLTIVVWALLVFSVSSFASSRYDFTPTFPYYQMLSDYPEGVRFLGHFDGLNYLRIVEKGYPKEGGEVAFFPLYPALIAFLSRSGVNSLYIGVSISLISLLIIAFLLPRLYKSKAMKTLLLLLTFPTSFYLLAAYTEAFFIFELILFLLLLKNKKWGLAALIAGLASGTRLVGAILGPILAVAYLKEHKNDPRLPNFKRIIITLILLIVGTSGIILYMGFLKSFLDDPLAFIHVQPQFNMGRSGGDIVFLPQVLYRYARMLATTSIFSQIFLRISWELITFLLLSYYTIKLWQRFSLTEKIFVSWGLLLPTLSGTLVSLPRYALVLIPLFHAFSKFENDKLYKATILFNSIILTINIIAFTRGFFVA